MRMFDIIQHKRHGLELTDEEIAFFVKNFTAGNIADYQASALLMAICCNGMTDRETTTLTLEMMNSGDTIDLSRFGNCSIDKHSTGGVGDKTTLIIAPVVSSLGGKMAKMSGRGLGHTGGTVDKLESIPGYKTSISPEEFLDIVDEHGVCVIGQSGDLAPADKKIYALRDVTATIDAVPLICSSIMSKKLAAGAKNIVLDVKVGSGAFMKTIEDARLLAEKMISVGESLGRNVRALVTNMDLPLGNAIGNSLEVIEAVEVLKGRKKGDIYDICVELSANLVSMFKEITYEEARKMVIEVIDNGTAYNKMKEWVASQGGDVSTLDDTSKLSGNELKREIVAEKNCFIGAMNAEGIGVAAGLTGAGRQTKADVLDLYAGIYLNKKTGDRIEKGDVIATIYASTEEKLDLAEKKFMESITFSSEKPSKPQLIF
ncbi:MAG: thymidine phosphorylase [Lachnospiraceae bacterium]|nr:thymidine phosphorylase [Lachnospiraceae bacterium]